LLGIALTSLLLMIYVVDPKLKAVSTDYEKKQVHYLKELDRIVKWED
jgi:hypothetical protein